jgi:hypothetical protein
MCLRATRVALLMIVLGALVAGSLSITPAQAVATADRATVAAKPDPRPSFVVVVMDDVSLELVRSMRTLTALQREGATYTNAFVVNSLCCPSRAATFTGQPRTSTGC